jgi:Ca2+-transporting ATPase
MATYHQEDAHILVAVKGAPESILNASTTIMTSEESHSFNEQEREAWKSKASALAEKGLRVLATATKTIETKETEPYTNLTFLALIGLIDPPRKDVQEAIKETHTAGIRIIMVTGDHPATARKIAYTVGLIENEKTEVSLGKSIKPIDEYIEEEKIQILETPIFARVTPEQKLHLVELHQERGAILAMTGDGVNDAPALQKADIGIAMGQRGTQVAKEAADMVLEDDAFHTIVLAIRQGRVIFNNIKKFVIYLLSCNFSEILVIALGILLNLPLLLIPIQILFLNILTDVFPALALGVGKGDPEIMKRLPRNPQAPMLNKRNWISLASYSFIITVFVLLSYWIGLFYFHFDQAILLTMAFVTLAFAQLWHVFNMREPRSNFFKNDVTTNRYVWLAIIVCVSILIIAIYLPPLAIGLELVPIAGTEWIIVLSLSLMPLLFGILIHAIETRVIICK